MSILDPKQEIYLMMIYGSYQRRLLNWGRCFPRTKYYSQFSRSSLVRHKRRKNGLTKIYLLELYKMFFWNNDLGYENSLSANFDWYSPVNAKDLQRKKYFQDLKKAKLKTDYFNEEDACFSGRFFKSKITQCAVF